MEEIPNINKKSEVSPEKLEGQEALNPRESPKLSNENQKNIPENFKVEEFVRFGKSLCMALDERHQENLSTIIEPEYVGMLYGEFKKLEEAVTSNSAEEADESLNKITKMLDEIGRAQKSGPTREDEESLAKLMYLLKNLAIESDNLKLKNITNIIEEKWNYLGRRAELLRSYESGY